MTPERRGLLKERVNRKSLDDSEPDNALARFTALSRRVREGRNCVLELIALIGLQHLLPVEARTTEDQFKTPAAQPDPHRRARCLARLGLAANLYDYTLALVQPLAPRHDLRPRQEGGPLVSDIDKGCAEPRLYPANPAEINAASLSAVAALDVYLHGDIVLEQRRTPLAGTGGDQQFANQLGR